MNNLKKRCLTLLLSLAMIVTYMPVSLIAYAEDDPAVPQNEQQVAEPAEEVTSDDTGSKDTVTEEVKSDDVKSNEAAKPAEKTSDEAPKPSDNEPKVQEPAKAGETGKSDVGLLTSDTTLTAEGEGFTVSALVGENAKVPADTELQAFEIKKSADEYDAYYQEALKALEEEFGETKKIKEIKFYDISLEAESQEESVKPQADVNVKIDYDNGIKMEDADTVQIVHFGDEKTEVLDQSENNVVTNVERSKMTEASFNTDGFSVFAVIVIENEEGTLTVKQDGYEITINYTKEANIPVGTELVVEEITPDQDKYRELRKKTIDKMNEGVEKESEDQPDPRKGLSAIAFFDISLHYNGKEIEPAVPLDVHISSDRGGILLPEGEKPVVVHFTDKKIEFIDKVDVDTVNSKTVDSILPEGEIATEFSYSQDSFSVVGIGSTGDYVEIKNVGNQTLRALRASGTDSIAASKDITDTDGDGIYDLSLSVTGSSESSSSTTVTKSNVVIVVDVSGSMDDHTYSVATEGSSDGTYYDDKDNGERVYWRNGKWQKYGWHDYEYGWYDFNGTVYEDKGTRLDNTKAALKTLVEALLKNNEKAPDAMEISLIKFANKTAVPRNGYNGTSVLISKSTSETDIDNQIDSLSAGGGTNWDAALDTANTEAGKYEKDQTTSIIFVTDGMPTLYGSDSGTGKETTSNVNDSWDGAKDHARSLIEKNGQRTNYEFYSIFAYGEGSDYLKALTNYAYTGSGDHNSTDTKTYSDGTKTTDHFFEAKDTSALSKALEAILDSISKTAGFGGVTVDDGVTLGVTNTSVTVDGSINTDSFKYTVKEGNTPVYTVKINGNEATFTINGQEYKTNGSTESITINGTTHTNTVFSVKVGDKTYKMSPASMDANGEVKWDLACLGTLENGYTYTLSFDVWPNQATYDAVADLNNGLKTESEIPESVRKNLVKKDGKYYAKTNYQQYVDYYTVNTEQKEGEEPVTTYTPQPRKELGPKDPVLLTSSEMDFRKYWKDNLDETQRQRYLYDKDGNSREVKITLHVWKAETIKELEKQIADHSGTPEEALANDYKEKVLGWNGTDYDWDDSLEVAPGTMILKSKAEEMGIDSSKHQVVTYEGKEYVVLEKGHYYTVTEDNIDSHYELNTIVYHPMLVDGVLSNVTFNDDGTVEKIVPMSEVAATNVLRGGININKKVIGDNNEELNYDGTFDMKVTLNAPKDKDGKPDLTNLEKYDGKTVAWYRYYEGKTAIEDENKLDFAGTADREGTFYWDDGWYYLVFDDSGKAEGTIKVNTKYTVRFTNMAAGTSYDLVETETNGMTPSYAFTHKDAAGGEDSDPAGEPHTVVANQENNISVTNTATLDPDKVIGPSFTIHKKDDAGNNMSGVEFTLTGKQSTGAAYSKEYSTDANGQILVDFEGFNFGTNGKEKYTFTLHEKTPAGHAGAGDWTINVKEDDETYTLTKVAEKENVFQKVWEWVINALTGTGDGNGTTEGSSTWNEETKVLEVINPVNVFDLTVVKTFSGIDKTEVPKDTFKINLDYKNTELKIDNNTAVSDDGLTFTWTVKDVPFGTKVKATENKPDIPGYEYDTNNKSAKDEDETTITVPEEGKETNTLKLNNPYKKKAYGLKVVKKFVGLENTDALADGYAISVKYGDSEKTLKLNSEGVQKEGMTYTWTVDNIPFKSSVTVKETGYDLAAYTEDTAVEVKNVANGKTNATEATFDMPANDAAQAEADFTNTYFRTPVTLKVEKKFDSWEKAAEFKFDITAKTAGAPMPDPTTVTATEKNPVQSFSELVFTEAKTYEYTIKEQNLHADGVTYDENEHKVVVKVEKKNSNSNELKATVTYDGEEVDKLTVTNTYKALDAKELIKVTKIFEDWGKASEFKFDLAAVGGTVGGKAIAAEDVPMPAETTVTATEASKTAVFGTIRYEKAGTYEYTITEQNLNADGVTYDTKPHKVVVTVVKDQKTNELTASALYDVKEDGTGLSKLEITNSYKPLELEGEKALKVNKELKGRAWKEGDSFEFVLSAVSGKVGGKDIDVKDVPMPEAGGEKATATAADKPAVFGKIKYEKAGTYVYKIVETNGKEDGLNYDNNCQEHTVIVEVKNNGGDTNELIATVTYDGKDSLTVINEKTSSNEVDVEVTKSFNKWDLPGVDKFEFTLTPLKGAPMPALTTATATKDDPETEADERIAKFGKIKYEKAGTYQYEIQETDPQIEGVTSDTSKHTVTVTVVKATDATNALTATIKYDNNNDALVITNKYDDASATLQATKAFDSWDNADEFIFDIATGSHPAGSTIPTPANTSVTVNKDATTGVFGEVTFKTAGTYEYTITERNLHADGVTYDSKEHKAIVTVAKNDAGKLVATVKYDGKDSLVITNSYKSLKAKELIKATKEMEDWGNATSFTFKLAAGTATYTDKSTGTSPMPASDEAIATKAKPLAVFGDIEYTKAGTYEYTLTEVNDHVDGVTYDTTAHKVVVTVENKGGDDNKLEATVKYDGKDSLTIKNSYKAYETDDLIEVTKDFNDWGKANEFKFDIAAVTENAPMPALTTATATKDDPETEADERIAKFGKIRYEKAGIYEYTITEQNLHADGVTYDTTAHKVVVTVDKDPNTNELSASVKYDDTKPELVIENTYTALDNVELKVSKDFNDWGQAESFTFNLTAVDNAPLPKKDGKVVTTVTVDKDHLTGIFGTVTYEKHGEYRYVIKEVDDGKDGVKYDTAEHNVLVKVVADKDTNALSATVTYDDKTELSVTNVYTSATQNLQVTKGFKNWDIADEFKFDIKPLGNAPKPPRTTVTATKNNPTQSFGEIEFKKEGTYKYEITEQNGGVDGVSYDTKVHTAVVTVVKGAGPNNALTASVKYDVKEDGTGSDTLLIENTFESVPTPAPIQVEKIFDAWGDAADSFTFNITDGGNNAAGVAKNPMPEKTQVVVTESATIQSFGQITFTKTGDYKYIIREVNDGKDGVTYDTTAHEVVVKVTKTNDATNKLKAEVTYDGKKVDKLTVTNTFTPVTMDAKNPVKVKKDLQGRDWTNDDKFVFDLTAVSGPDGVTVPLPQKDGKAVTTVTATKDNKEPEFGLITFVKAGTYEYKIKEQNSKADGVEYDVSDHSLKIVVEKNKDTNELTISSVLYDTDKKSLTVTNTYTSLPMPTDQLLKVTKELKGRDWLDKETFDFTLAAGTATYTDGTTGTSPMPAGSGKVASATKDAPAVFGQMTFEKTGTYQYKITENKGNKGGITYDTKSYDVTVVIGKVNDNTNALKVDSVTYDSDKDSLTVTNTYKAEGTAEFDAKKILKGREMKAGEFTFELKQDGVKVGEAKNDAEGKVTFEGVKFVIKVDDNGEVIDQTGEYEFTISEVEPTTGKLGGVTYDKTVAKIKVDVTDNHDGTLGITYDDKAKAPTPEFTNTYEAEGKLELKGLKTLEYGDLTEQAFNFKVLDASGKEVATAVAGGKGATVTGDANTKAGTKSEFKFSEIKYVIKVDESGKVIDQTGDYTYTIKEVIPDEAVNKKTGKTYKEDPAADGIFELGNYRYDNSEKTVKVKVSDNGDGSLKVEQTEGDAVQSFTNTKAYTEVEITKDLKNYVQHKGVKEVTLAFRVVDKETKGSKFSAAGGITFTQAEVESGEPKKVTIAKIPTDIPVEVTEVYASNFKPGDDPSDYTVELKLEDGVYKASFTNTFDDVNYNSGIINNYKKNADGEYEHQKN